MSRVRGSFTGQIAQLALSVAAVFLGLPVTGSATDNPALDLERGFAEPPNSAKPHTWWHWVNDNISKEGITADLEAMKRVGVAGAQIFNVDCGVPSGPVKFMSPQWREMIKHAAKEADRLGLELCIHNCAGWSSSGGPWVTPEHAMQMVVTSRAEVKGPRHFSEVLPQPETRRNFYRDIAVLAFRTPDGKLSLENLRGKAAYERADNIQPSGSSTAPLESVIERQGVVDLTSHLESNGRLTWEVPEGDWTILRIGYTPTGKDNHPATPEGRGLEVDKLSREALDVFWSGMMGTVISDLGPLAGKVLNNVLVDSYEVGSQNWTPRFREEFQKRCGYDLLPYLPVFAGYVVESPEVSERFLWDVRRTVADLFAENYYGYLSELCHKHQMKFSTEPYGNGPFEDLTCGGRADIPMGEFWVGGGASSSCKLAASAAHIYGKPIVGAESFTATPEQGRWQNYPYSLKALGDLIYCLGVNRFIFHRYAHQPWLNLKPGMTMGPWGFHFERTNTWWEQGKAWLKYLARCQFLLQQGLFVADVCYFAGEHAPNSLPYHPELKEKGYDYDGCNAEVIIRRMSVKDGRIVLPDGMSYRLLVLPESEMMTPELLRKVRQLVQAGATVLGPKPVKSPSLQGYPDCDDEVKRLANEIWGDCDGKSVTEHAFGKGKVIWGRPLEEVLTSMGIKPDFEFVGERKTARLTYIHRRAGDTDIYFISNQKNQFEAVECTFRVSGKVPELWHPDTGKIERAPVFVEREGRTRVPLLFEPAGSVFVVFRKPARSIDWVVSVKHNSRSLFQPKRKVAGKLEIRKAIYGVLEDPQKCVDVTAQLSAMVEDNALSVEASNRIAGDPAPMIVKKLRVDYTVGGVPYTKTVNENELLEIPDGATDGYPAAELAVTKTEELELKAWEAGKYELKTASGKRRKIEVSSVPAPIALPGPWEVRFPPNWGAPKKITLEKLISWTEHPDPGVKYFSGTAIYLKEFEVPARFLKKGSAVYLDLGEVKVIAEVKINGKDFGVIWKPPFRLDITKALKAGKNQLEVRITNLWPNRLIGDEQFPDDREWKPDGALKEWPKWFLEGEPRPPRQKYTWTTWRHYTKGSALLPSGLLGPVEIRVAIEKRISLR